MANEIITINHNECEICSYLLSKFISVYQVSQDSNSLTNQSLNSKGEWQLFPHLSSIAKNWIDEALGRLADFLPMLSSNLEIDCPFYSISLIAECEFGSEEWIQSQSTR